MGPGYRIGVVTHLCYAALVFILIEFFFFFFVGLCSHGFLPFVGHVAAPQKLDTRTSIESRRYDGLRVYAIFIEWAKGVAIDGSWDCGPRSSFDRSRRSVFTESDGPRFSLTFSYKNRCSSLCILTFDRFVKQLTEFEGRS